MDSLSKLGIMISEKQTSTFLVSWAAAGIGLAGVVTLALLVSSFLAPVHVQAQAMSVPKTEYRRAIGAGIGYALPKQPGQQANYTSALGALNEAIRMDPSNPRAYYYSAEVRKLQGKLDEALQQYRLTLRIAQQGSDETYEARALQGIAQCLEHQGLQRPELLPQARIAWEQLKQFESQHPRHTKPTAQTRMDAIDEWQKVQVAAAKSSAAKSQ